jgi:hypothetical protein
MGAHVRGSFVTGDEVGIVEDLVLGAGPVPFGCAVVAAARGGRTVHAPTAGPTQAGDRVTCLRLAARRAEAARKPADSLFRAALAGLRDWWRQVPGPARLALAALAGVVAFSVVLFQLALDLSPVDAFYFVITTITTVGYGDHNFADAALGMKLYGSFLMLCGAALLATLFSLVTDAVLGKRFRGLFARDCSQARGQVIVAGLGSIGYRLVKELVRSGEAVVAIEQREAGEFVQPAREEATVVLGNARMGETLRRAGVAGAKALVAATDNDLVNLTAGLAAKHARPDCRVVVRVFDSQLAEKMQGSLGVDAVLSVSAAAAPTFVGCALCARALQGVVLDDGLVLICRRQAGEGATCPAEAEAVLFVCRRGQDRFEVPATGYVPQADDELIGSCWHPFRERRAAT